MVTGGWEILIEEGTHTKEQHSITIWYFWSQCNPGFQNKVQGDPDYDTKLESFD